MRIKSLHLQNIRSYADQVIEFPEGSLLLAGDIGSGKTTILLAIEFALFGLLRSHVPGSSLLRHGARQGGVALTIHLHNKELTIKRSLKLEKDSISQEAGAIIIDGVTHDLTASELKTKVLELLGYPQSLLAKSKNLIYRYTVFCPQEEMKRILEEEEEGRLETLRRLFNVDKYKRIQENCKILLQELRLKKSALEAEAKGFGELQEEEARITGQLAVLEGELKVGSEKLAAACKQLEEAALLAKKSADAVRKVLERKQEAAALSARKKAKHETLQLKEQQLVRIRAELAKLGTIIVPNREELRTRTKNLEQEARSIEQEVRIHIAKKAELKAKQFSLNETKNKITVLDHCPLCLQEVNHQHKQQIASDADTELKTLSEQIAAVEKEIAGREEKILAARKDLEQKRQLERDAETLALRKQQAENQQRMIADAEKEIEQLNREIKSLAEQETLLAAELVGSAGLEQEAQKAELRKEEARKLCQSAEVQEARLKENERHLRSNIEQLKKNMESMLKAKRELERISGLHHYLDEHFLNLMSVMEKHVLAAVYNEFNSCFQSVFGMLVDGLTAQLDDTFAPVVMQDGYVTAFASLSGGERTACALAYRLALNKVINSVVSTIHTRDLLILDEPTDGFSDEQVEKLRDVLEQLNIRQTIIVSHEPKMESFVENVIRVQKQEGNSFTSHFA